MTNERGSGPAIFLMTRAPSEGRMVHLYLNARRPQQLLRAAPGIQRPEDVAAGIVVEDGCEPELNESTEGGLTVTRGLLWSLLDPCRAGDACELAARDLVEAEQRLRSEGRRLWARLRWWADLPEQTREDCRRLLASFSASAARLLRCLTELSVASRSDPFGGWQADSVPAPSTGVQDPVPSGSAAGRDTTRELAPLEAPRDPRALAAWLSDEKGLGALYGERFTPRAEQGEMAAEIASALSSERPLLIEAGTGVGKTLAYLVPLLLEARQRSCRAVVSTHTRALQVQLLEHDFPLLAPLFAGVKARLLMGRQNYLCRRRQVQFMGQPVESFASACAVACLRLWLGETTEGMREELTEHPVLRRHLRALFDSAETCSAVLCYDGSDCYVQRARRQAREADLLIVNHALLMSDLAAEHTLIGDYALLMVDEAHRLPQVALESHAVLCNRGRPRLIEDLLGESPMRGGEPALLRRLRTRMSSLGQLGQGVIQAAADLCTTLSTCLGAYDSWWDALSEHFEHSAKSHVRPTVRVRVRNKDEYFGPLRPTTAAFLAAADTAAAAYALLARRSENLEQLEAADVEMIATLAQAGQLLDQLQRDVRFLTEGGQEDWVTWLEPAAKSGVWALGATLLESGRLLREYWFSSQLRPVMTSATLAVGENFQHMLAELGLTRWRPAVRTALVASPFDYRQQTLFLTSPNLPTPDQADFATTLTGLLRMLLLQVPRKTLVLFTSYQLLQRVAHELQEESPEPDLFQRRPHGPEVIVQEPGGGAAELARRFRRPGQAMLLGTTTFWEGVDFPGDDLEVLIVTKLPFLVPSDPWVEARCERIQASGENPFTSFMVRDAVLRLRQGVGRLIRRRSDRGVVMLLDTRLHTKEYGVTFLQSLPVPPRFCSDVAEMAAQAQNFFCAPGSPSSR